MQPKPFSRLNVTELKALIASSNSASEREKARERLTKLTSKSKVDIRSSQEDIPARVDPLTANRILREYYAKADMQSTPVPNVPSVNDTTKTIIIDIPRDNLLSHLEKDYEIVEINMKLVRKPI